MADTPERARFRLTDSSRRAAAGRGVRLTHGGRELVDSLGVHSVPPRTIRTPGGKRSPQSSKLRSGKGLVLWSPHALATIARGIGASLPLPSTVLPLARMRRPSSARTRLPALRLVQETERHRTHPSLPMP